MRTLHNVDGGRTLLFYFLSRKWFGCGLRVYWCSVTETDDRAKQQAANLLATTLIGDKLMRADERVVVLYTLGDNVVDMILSGDVDYIILACVYNTWVSDWRKKHRAEILCKGDNSVGMRHVSLTAQGILAAAFVPPDFKRLVDICDDVVISYWTDVYLTLPLMSA